MRTIFITGATGAVGSAVVGALLGEADTHLRLLIRAASPQELDARVQTLLQFLEVAPSDREARGRVRGLRGDATAPSLGLDAVAHADLCAETTHIIHSAGAVRMNLPIDEARRSAVDSARNIVALARACRKFEKIEFVSTVGVGGRMGGTLPEHWIEAPRDFHNTYEQAKAEAEDYVRVEAERGLPLTVHRPSMVVGDSRTGAIAHFQVFYHLCEFLSGRRTLGLCPRLGRTRLDIVPADCVARAIAWSTGQVETVGKVLHLCSGPRNSVSLPDLRRQVREQFRAAGRRLPPTVELPSKVFLGAMNALAMVAGAKARRAIGTLPVFLDYLATDQAFANDSTTALLAAAGLAVPRPEVYLPVVIGRYLTEQGLEPDGAS